MKADRRTKLFIGGSAIALLVILAVPSRKSKAPPMFAVPLAAVLQPMLASRVPGTVATEEQLQHQRERAEQLGWGKDPFSTPFNEPQRIKTSAQKPVTVTNMRLTGISTYGSKRMALLDHQIVSEGTQLASGYTVGEITATTVALHRDQELLILSLGSNQ